MPTEGIASSMGSDKNHHNKTMLGISNRSPQMDDLFEDSKNMEEKNILSDDGYEEGEYNSDDDSNKIVISDSKSPIRPHGHQFNFYDDSDYLEGLKENKKLDDMGGEEDPYYQKASDQKDTDEYDGNGYKKEAQDTPQPFKKSSRIEGTTFEKFDKKRNQFNDFDGNFIDDEF